MQIKGIYKDEGGIWQLDKVFRGQRIRGSSGTRSYEEAVTLLEAKKQEINLAQMHGVRPKRRFRLAATHYLETKEKRSLEGDVLHLEQLDPFIGDLFLDQVHDGTLKPFVEKRLADGRRPSTVNRALEVVRHILNLCAKSWRDEHGLTWLIQEPKITMLKVKGTAAKPYPLSWVEQRKLFQSMDDDLAEVCLFKVNTGLREQEVCNLRWEWECDVLGYNASVFIIPESYIKNGEERMVVLNDIASSIIERRRGNDSELVFPSPKTGKVRGCLNNSGWKNAWRRAGLPVSDDCKRGVHNLKHTFGRRLRAAGVGHEDRQVLLGHTNGSTTTHYSGAEILGLIDAANMVCRERKEAVLRSVIGKKSPESPQKVPGKEKGLAVVSLLAL